MFLIMIADFIVHFFAIVVVACQYTSSAWMPPATISTTTTTTTTTTSATIRRPTSYFSPKSRSFAFHSKNHLNAEKNKNPTTTTNSEEEADSSSDSTTMQDDDDTVNEIKWGVSYIGGDPCGSKYNDDPFDKNPSDKPGFPDDMKARIEALAKQKLRERE